MRPSDHNELARPLLRNALLSLVAVGILGSVGSAILAPGPMVGIYLLLPPAGALGLWSLRQGHVRAVAWALLITLSLLLCAFSPVFGGHDSPAVFAWPVVILFAALTLGLYQALAVAVFGALSILGLVAAEAWGWEATPASTIDVVLVQLAILFATADMAGRTLQRLGGTLDDSRNAESAAREALVARDHELTRRNAVERQLHDALSEANAASEAKSRFLANMSHELRTPLNAIIGYAEILLEESVDDDAAQDAGRIRSSGKHLLSLINDVLDLSRIEAGAITLVPSDVDLAKLIRDVVEAVRPRTAKNGTTLRLDLPEELGTVHADPMRVRQVLLNLMSNAAKFTEHGTVTLAATRCEEGGREVVRLAVRDTGIGISDAQMARLFRPFAQADDSTVRRFGGTGLGLVLSKRFAEMMEGEIVAHSELGVGSEFTFVLPVSTVAGHIASLTAIRAREAEGTERPVVLCVDDEADTLHLLDRTLGSEGLLTVPCLEPQSAMELARRLRPAAITLDLHMPGLDGWTLLEQLRADEELAEIPVVIVSIEADDGHTRTVDANAWLQKPVDRSQLLQLLATHRTRDEGPVLVVEDDESTRDIIRRTLVREGLEVVEARNGFEAMAALESVQPSLMLLDLMMPGMDGFAVVERMKEMPKDFPVVVLTAAVLTAKDRQRLSSVHDILTKDAETLLGIVDEIRRAVA